MRRISRLSPATAVFLLASTVSCTVEREQPNLVDQDVRLTFIHTSDIHSRLFPYRFDPGRIDENYGLEPGEGPYGGIARMASIIKKERRGAARSLWLDSGDSFQGAPVFNMFRGEVEFRALSLIGLDGTVLGNHEIDLGANNLYEQITHWAQFPVLGANYLFEDSSVPSAPKLGEVIQPYQLYDLDGVKVAVIGMGNTSTITSIFEGGNSLGFRPLDEAEVVPTYVRLLRPVADLVVLVSHMGLDEDEGLAPSQVTDMNETLPLEGVDLVFGGHLHIVLNPPKILHTDPYGHPTVLCHSGAFAKYVGRLDAVVHVGADKSDPAQRSFVKAFTYDNIPVSCGPRDNPTDPFAPCPNEYDAETTSLLQQYSLELNEKLNLHDEFAFVNSDTKLVRADPSGGDSQLGNLVAKSMQVRPGVDADFAITNSLGIRADFEKGRALTLEDMYNVFPFENSITIMFLSGNEVQETLNFVARKSSDRGCRTQAQMAGLSFKMVCGKNARAEDVYIGDHCRRADGSLDEIACHPLVPEGLYRVAVNDYIAAGGSGFTVLKRNTSKQNTGISLRAALMEYIRKLPKCAPDIAPVSCLDPTIEPHDGRILTVVE